MARFFANSMASVILVLGFSGVMGVQARADQAFLCEDGRVIKVAQGELAHMKRTNACIGAHFGLVVREAEEGVPPLPVRRVLDVATRGSTFDTARKDSKFERQVAFAAKAAATAKPKRAKANARPNYRDVVVINARTGAGKIFRHRH